MGKICNMDCFNCVYDDCINDTVSAPRVYSRKIRYRDLPEDQKSLRRERVKRVYHDRREKGLCVRCGKKKATNGVYCLECYLMVRRLKRESGRTGKRDLWIAQGLCRFCGEPVVDGRKVCKKHYESCIERLNTPEVKRARAESRRCGKVASE